MLLNGQMLNQVVLNGSYFPDREIEQSDPDRNIPIYADVVTTDIFAITDTRKIYADVK